MILRALPLLAGLALLAGCHSPQSKAAFNPQEEEILEAPLATVQAVVPHALADLGMTLSREVPTPGHVSFDAVSAGGLDVTIKLEAMTLQDTQLRVCVFGYSTYGDWLAEKIVDAVADAVDAATRHTPDG